MKKLRVTRGRSQDKHKTINNFRRTKIGKDDGKLNLGKREKLGRVKH